MNWEQIKDKYLSYDGIIMTIPDWKSHIDKMKIKILETPGWYANDQIESQYNGPYRVHLKRRQKYLKKTINDFLSLEHSDSGDKFRTIDVGCGDGQHLSWLRSMSRIDLYGSDYNLLRLRRAKKSFPFTRLLLMNVLDIPFDDNYFDIILCNHVLEHIHDDQSALKEMERVLSPEGTLILGVPNEGSEWWQLAYDLEPNLREITDHVHFYTADSIYNLIQHTDLKCIETKWMGYGLPHFTADSIFRNMDGIDDLMEKIGQTYFKEQASSLYFILKKQ